FQPSAWQHPVMLTALAVLDQEDLRAADDDRRDAQLRGHRVKRVHQGGETDQRCAHRKLRPRALVARELERLARPQDGGRQPVRWKRRPETVFATTEQMCYHAPVLQDDQRRRQVDRGRLHADADGQTSVLRCCDRGLRTPPLPYLTAPPGTALGAR